MLSWFLSSSGEESTVLDLLTPDDTEEGSIESWLQLIRFYVDTFICVLLMTVVVALSTALNGVDYKC